MRVKVIVIANDSPDGNQKYDVSNALEFNGDGAYLCELDVSDAANRLYFGTINEASAKAAELENKA